MTEKLLPCPFCGGSANVIVEDTTNLSIGFYVVVSCPSCLAQMRVEMPNMSIALATKEIENKKKQLAAIWNRRETQPHLPEGYALVPVEPTAKMVVDATETALKDGGDLRDVYRAMLAAAQKESEE